MGLKIEQNEDELSNIVLGVAINIHSQFGPGLLENAYKKVLAIKLQNLGLIINFNVTKLKYGIKRVINTKNPRPF